MKGLTTVFRRELFAYFNSPIAVIFLAVFVVFTNGLFMMYFFQAAKADMRPLFGSLPFILNIFVPAISMRLWAEERRSSTFELLLTFPMSPSALVLGKYLASLVFYATALATTLTVPAMIGILGHADPGPIASGYLAAFLMGAFFLAAGIFVSGLSKDQIVAFVLSVVATFAVFFAGTDTFAAFLDGWIAGTGTFVKETFGMAARLVGFNRGVVRTSDLLYFIVGIGLLLFLNGASLEGRMRPKSKTVLSAAAAVALSGFILFNWLVADLGLPRWDLTEGKLYTVSEASLKILRGLKVPAEVKLYVSPAEKMPTQLKTLEREVADKLEEMKTASGGKLRYRVIHLEGVPDEKDGPEARLKDMGVVPFQVESVERDEVGVKLIYSTLVIEYKEKPNEIIPRILPGTIYDLEYQLVSRIHKMTFEEKPEIAIYSGAKDGKLPEEHEDHFKTASVLIRNNGYRATRIALTKESAIPENARMLLMLDAGALTDRQRFEVNRYLSKGGTLVVGQEAFAYTFRREERGVEAVPEKKTLGVNALLEKFGAKISDKVLMDENAQVISLSTGQTYGPFAVEMPVKFLNQIVVPETQMNRESALTNRLPSLFLLWPSALELGEGVAKSLGLETTVLFTSSPRSWTFPWNGENLTEASNDPPASLPGGYPLAVLFEGQFPDVSNGAPAPAWSEADAEAGPKIEGLKPGTLLVVGSSKAFDDDLIQSNAGNVNLFANIVDGLTIGQDLVHIRSKVSPVRDIRRTTAAERFGFKLFTVALVPFVVVGAAILRAALRRREKEAYIAARAAR